LDECARLVALSDTLVSPLSPRVERLIVTDNDDLVMSCLLGWEGRCLGMNRVGAGARTRDEATIDEAANSLSAHLGQ
jgi:hypothetical protein